jgi:hypothetical protein
MTLINESRNGDIIMTKNPILDVLLKAHQSGQGNAELMLAN